jgi:OmpA-OmpF porin, OOP family
MTKKIRRLSVMLFLLTCLYTARPQGLVLNGDLEALVSCPGWMGQIAKAQNWCNPTIDPLSGGNGGSPELFNDCALHNCILQPANCWGYQIPHSGHSYAGLCLWGISSDFREYIEVELAAPLAAHTRYYFQMYISLADICAVTTRDIGVYFSDTLITGLNHHFPLPFTPQFQNTSVAFDTLNWKKVSGWFAAQGGEKYLIIGNFKNDGATAVQTYNSSAQSNFAYVFVDDVYVSATMPADEQEMAGFGFSPNPSNGKITLHGAQQVRAIAVTDVFGREVYSGSSTDLDLTFLPPGIYMLILEGGGKKYTDKIVIK